MSETEGASNAAERVALEAAFAEAMKGQQAATAAPAAAPPMLPGAPQMAKRVFSFTGSGGSGFSPQISQGDDGEVSPAFGRTRPAAGTGSRSFSRGTSGGTSGGSGLEERLQHLEELLMRSNEYHMSQMRKQQEMEVKIGERCGFVVQEVLQSMTPFIVESLLDRLAQSLDFSELRDQLIDAFSSSTEMIPVVEERSEFILALLQEDRVVKTRISQEFNRVASSLDTLATNSNWQVPMIERLEALQRAVESMGFAVRSASMNGTADPISSAGTRSEEASSRKLPGQAKEKQRTLSGEGLQGLQVALQRAEQQSRSRPPSGHPDRAPTRPLAGRSTVNGKGNDPSWYTSPARPPAEGNTTASAASNGRAPLRAPNSTSPASDSPANKAAVAPMRGSFGRAPSPGRDWPWQSKAPVVEEEVQPEPAAAAAAVPMLPMQPPRSKPSDFFSVRKSDPADSKG